MRLRFLFCSLVLLSYAGQPQAQRPVWPDHAEYMARVQAESKSSTEQEESSPATRIESYGGYVVQLGAFREQSSAERAAKAGKLEEIKVLATQRNGQTWYVLLLGSYKSREEAREASAAYLQAHPDGSTWVRSSADLR